MSKPRLLLTCELMPEVMGDLEERYDVLRLYDAIDPDTLLREHGDSIRAVVTGGHIGWPVPMAEKTPNLELVAINGVGYDKVDLDQARSRGFRITNTPDVLSEDVADLAVGLIIASFRQIADGNTFARDGRWLGANMPLGRKVTGLRFGIYGLGQIGTEIANRLRAFGGNIAYCSRTPKSVPFSYYATLVDLAQHSDVVVLAAAATPANRHVVNAEVLNALGPQGLLVNVARSSLIDEAALVTALTEGRLGGAALDVVENEPRIDHSVLSASRTLITPHIGSATRETRREMGRLLIENVDAHFQGRSLPSPVV